MHAMECIVRQDFGSDAVQVRLSSAFSGDVFHIVCYHNFNPNHAPFPSVGFDKEQVENLKHWLDNILNKYDHAPNPCQNCFKALPKTAALNDQGYWIVSCEHCNHQHEIGRSHG